MIKTTFREEPESWFMTASYIIPSLGLYRLIVWTLRHRGATAILREILNDFAERIRESLAETNGSAPPREITHLEAHELVSGRRVLRQDRKPT